MRLGIHETIMYKISSLYKQCGFGQLISLDHSYVRVLIVKINSLLIVEPIILHNLRLSHAIFIFPC